MSLLLLLPVLQAAPPPSPGQALTYLAQYGYLPPGSTAQLFDRFEAGLGRYQQYWGLPRTGLLDPPTRQAISRPRCPLPDTAPSPGPAVQVALPGQVAGRGTGREKRAGRGVSSVWRARDLTWRVEQYPALPAPVTVDNTVAAALALWANTSRLTFTQRSYGPVHIRFRFQSRRVQ